MGLPVIVILIGKAVTERIKKEGGGRGNDGV